MHLTLDFGKTGLEVTLPETHPVTVIGTDVTAPLQHPQEVVLQALENPIASLPLSQLAAGKASACVVVSDITRPVPNCLILPPLLATLEQAGIARERISILIGTGCHRPNLGDELVELLGEEVASNYRIVNHDAGDAPAHQFLGYTLRGTPVTIDRRYVEAELKVLTGLIEPHIMAGYSGGRKAICPGIAGLETIRAWHGPQILESSRTTAGILSCNPAHEEALAVAQVAGADFTLNVSLNLQRDLTGVFAGDLKAAFRAGAQFVDGIVRTEVPHPFDVVLTTGGGYPLDATFYQTIKGLLTALPIIKERGTIVLVAELSEGIGDKEFTKLILDVSDIQQFMRDITSADYFVIDQWQLEMLAHALKKAEVFAFAPGLDSDTLGKLFVTPFDSIQEALEAALAKYGQKASLAVLPQGPYLLPVLKGREVPV